MLFSEDWARTLNARSTQVHDCKIAPEFIEKLPAAGIIKRTWGHRNKVIPSFTAKYKVHMLVYYEMHELYIEAARREKRFKNWPRQWKINVIEKLNPEWRDLYEEICQSVIPQ